MDKMYKFCFQIISNFICLHLFSSFIVNETLVYIGFVDSHRFQKNGMDKSTFSSINKSEVCKRKSLTEKFINLLAYKLHDYLDKKKSRKRMKKACYEGDKTSTLVNVFVGGAYPFTHMIFCHFCKHFWTKTDSYSMVDLKNMSLLHSLTLDHL